MKLLLALSSGILLVLGLGGSGALGAPSETCAGPITGTHGSVTVTGFCAGTGNLTVDGDLTLAAGTVFMGFGPSVHVTGNVKVGKGAVFSMGYNRGEGVLGPDVVDGNIVANQPLSLYLGNSTVHGNVVSNGGGTSEKFFNLPIKDNRIDGNLIIHGWTGGWWGVIANTVGGNVDLSNNRSVVVPANEQECEGTFPAGCAATPGVDEDAAEVQSRFIPAGAFGPGAPPVTISNPQHIAGNLICHGNTPRAQVNAGDGGAKNIVDGNKIGECAGL